MKKSNFKGLSLSAFSCALMISAYSIPGFAQATVQQQIDAQVQPMDKFQAQAACETVSDELAKVSENNEILDRQSLNDAIKSCNDIIKAGQALVQKLGPQYYLFGVGVFAGVELNPPFRIKKAGFGFRGAVGASAFTAYNPDTRTGVDFRFAPMVNLVPVSVQVSNKPAEPVETNRGIVLFIASVFGENNRKSMRDFNGYYGGLGFEAPSIGNSELKNTSSFSPNAYMNMHTGAIAVTYLKSRVAGSELKGVHGQVLHVNTEGFSAEGGRITDFLSPLGKDFMRLIRSASEGAASAFDSGVDSVAAEAERVGKLLTSAPK